ncbi:MAG: hypothetical protein ACREGG_02410 [Candidatus Saccharimonadales bacterium]
MAKKKSRLNKKIILASTIVALIVVIAILELTNTTHLFHKQKVPAVIPSHSNSATTPKNNQSTAQSGSLTPSTPATTKSSSSTGGSNAALVAPFGDFVSNHNPGALDSNGNPTPTSETSVCDTTPGATCYIKFTNTDGGQTTQLASQTVNGDGSTSWYWDATTDAHLTKGQWRVTAIATLNGQSKSTDDPTNLTIQ